MEVNRTEKITFRCTALEKAALAEQAARCGISILTRMQGFDLAGFSCELGKLGFKVREARASTGKLNGYYVEARSGTEYKASEIGKGYTLAHIEKTQKKLKYNSISRNYGNILKPKDGGLHL